MTAQADTKKKAVRENKDKDGNYWYIADISVEGLQLTKKCAEDIFDQRGGCRSGSPSEIVSFDWGVLSTSDIKVANWLDKHKNFSNESWRVPVGNPARTFRSADPKALEIIARLKEEGVARKEWHNRINRIRRAYDATESFGA